MRAAEAEVSKVTHMYYVFSSVGAPTAPSISDISEYSRTDDIITIKVNLQQSLYGFECIQNYTVIVRADGEEVVRNDSTSPGEVLVQVPVCPRQYTFTALACSPMLGCSNESAPETFNVTDGECTVFD